ncbi:hypothetical protein CPB86DRAFT_784330, partial [Serendipita vermifera]
MGFSALLSESDPSPSSSARDLGPFGPLPPPPPFPLMTTGVDLPRIFPPFFPSILRIVTSQVSKRVGERLQQDYPHIVTRGFLFLFIDFFSFLRTLSWRWTVFQLLATKGARTPHNRPYI